MKDETSINNFFLSDGQTALPKLTHGSLFSGIGGFDLAAEWMGWENVFHCEWNPFGQKILNYYWPKAKSYNDITKTDFSIHRGTIDILTGGFPCQPYSAAGKRLGKEDDRHLWPEMLRAIREIQPTWIVGENVRGLTDWNGGMVFDEVQAQMEVEGYEVTPFLLPACALNAPHRRDRIWFVAHSNKIMFDASFTKDSKDKIDRQYKAKWSESWSKFELVTGLGHSGIGFSIGESPEPSIIGYNDGLSFGLDAATVFEECVDNSNEGFGNAIVPQVAFEIFKCISAFEQGGKKIINTVPTAHTSL